MALGRKFVGSLLICLLTLFGHGDTTRFSGISLMQFCNCWKATVARAGNVIYINISFDKQCWESPMKNPGGFQIIRYNSTMLFRIGVTESFRNMLNIKELRCPLNKGCDTNFTIVRDTSVEIAPFCKSCDSCRGVETDYISYIYGNDKEKHISEVVTLTPPKLPNKTSFKLQTLLLASAVPVIVIVTIIIVILVCRIRKIGEHEEPIIAPSDSTDEDSDVSSTPMQPLTCTEVPDTQRRRQPVNIGVFYPHMPKELSSQTPESPMDIHVKRMINILSSVQELEVKHLTTNLSNLCDGIEEVSCSPRIILVLCDRFCELGIEGSFENGNITEKTWANIEKTLLRRIREKYYQNTTYLYLVHFKEFRQQFNTLKEVRDIFTSQSYKVYSIDSLDQSDNHFKELLDSILSEVILDSDERNARIISLLNQTSNAMLEDQYEDRILLLNE